MTDVAGDDADPDGLENEETDGSESPDEGEEDEQSEEQKAAAEKEAQAKAANQRNAGQARRERAKRVAAETRAQELESRLADLERRTGGKTREDDLLDLIGQLPDNEDDPIGDIATLKRALKLYRERESAAGQQGEQQRAIEREVVKLRTAMGDAEEDFAADHADYYEAATFYRKSRTEELKEAGYSGAFLERKLADDLFGVVRMSLESGNDPAERVYTLAARRGFKPGDKAANSNLDKLDKAAATGVRAAARSPGGTLSWGDVAKLDGAARDKAWAKLREREKARSKGA